MGCTLPVIVTLVTLCSIGSHANSFSREERLLNFFRNTVSGQTIKENTVLGTYQALEGVLNITRCVTRNNLMGICLTSNNECAKLGGTVQGTCSTLAKCCVVEMSCNGQTAMNNTYFVGPGSLGTGQGSCSIEVQRQKDEEICQMRLDFYTFVLAPPIIDEALLESRDGMCLTDTMEVSGITNKITVFCGTNSGKHVYAHLDRHYKTPVKITIKSLGTFVDRQWRIKITQYGCNADYKAPDHCTEYYTDLTGTLTSPNFILGGGKNKEIVNSFSRICIRRESGFCSICYTQCSPQDESTFSVTAAVLSMGNAMCPADFLSIPCAQMDNHPFRSDDDCRVNLFCGRGTLGTRCTPFPPFEILYYANSVDSFMERSKGFCLMYQQQGCEGRRQ